MVIRWGDSPTKDPRSRKTAARLGGGGPLGSRGGAVAGAGPWPGRDRRRPFWILPIALRGSSGTKSIRAGHLNRVSPLASAVSRICAAAASRRAAASRPRRCPRPIRRSARRPRPPPSPPGGDKAPLHAFVPLTGLHAATPGAAAGVPGRAAGVGQAAADHRDTRGAAQELGGRDRQGPAARAVLAGRGPAGLSLGSLRYLRMLTARATTSTATTSEIASSAIIMSLDQGRIAETSVGLKAAAVVKARCR